MMPMRRDHGKEAVVGDPTHPEHDRAAQVRDTSACRTPVDVRMGIEIAELVRGLPDVQRGVLDVLFRSPANRRTDASR